MNIIYTTNFLVKYITLNSSITLTLDDYLVKIHGIITNLIKHFERFNQIKLYEVGIGVTFKKKKYFESLGD